MASYAREMLQVPSEERREGFTSIWLSRLSREYGPPSQQGGYQGALRARADLGDTEALRELYYLRLYGEGGVSRDGGRAHSLLEELLEREPINRRDDLFYLGTVLEDSGDTKRAVKYYTQAAEMGHRIACATLAFIYSCGWKGMVKSDARKTTEFAAEALNFKEKHSFYPLPTHCMSMFANGLYVLRRGWFYDPVDALSYFALYNINRSSNRIVALGYLEKAANGRLGEAQEILGNFYLTGDGGCPKQLLCARFWLAQAANQGREMARDVLFKLKTDSSSAVVPAEPLIENFRKHQERVRHIQADSYRLLAAQKKDPTSVYVSNREMLDEDTLEFYATHLKSPTAGNIKKCLENFKGAENILSNSSVPSLEGIYKWAHAVALDDTYMKYFLPDMSEVLGQAQALIIIHPDDFVLKYVYYYLKWKIDQQAVPKFIGNLEFLAAEYEEKVSRSKDQVERDVMYDVLYRLGSMYHVTYQYLRSIDAFHKSRQFRPDCYEALYGEAYTKYTSMAGSGGLRDPFTSSPSLDDPEMLKAVELLEEYLKNSPPCGRKRPGACLTLAEQYVRKNHRMFINYMEKFFVADCSRLPFFIQDNPRKEHLLFAFPLYRMGLCFNDTCDTLEASRTGENLRRCSRCAYAVYCSQNCQREHYKNHKRSCYAIAGIKKK